MEEKQSIYCENNSYLKNILRANLRKNVTIYISFKNVSPWNHKIVEGILVGVGNDHIVIENIIESKNTLILLKNIDYIETKQSLDYFYPFNSGFNA